MHAPPTPLRYVPKGWCPKPGAVSAQSSAQEEPQASCPGRGHCVCQLQRGRQPHNRVFAHCCPPCSSPPTNRDSKGRWSRPCLQGLRDTMSPAKGVRGSSSGRKSLRKLGSPQVRKGYLERPLLCWLPCPEIPRLGWAPPPSAPWEAPWIRLLSWP